MENEIKENGNITEKKTFKQLASDLGMNEKTMRKYINFSDHLKILRNNIGDEICDQFEKVFCKYEKNKKKSISFNIVQDIVCLPPELQQRICNAVINDKNDNPKQAIKDFFKNDDNEEVEEIIEDVKEVTVILPQEVEQYYSDEAKKYNISREQYIEMILGIVANQKKNNQ